MHKMRIALISILIVLPLFATSQSVDRKGKTLPSVNFRNSITKATGWVLKDNGKWESGTNKIPSARSGYGSSNNFRTIWFGDVVVDGESLFIIAKSVTKGRWKYPSIQAGWYQYSVVDFWTFSPQELSKLNLDNTYFNTSYSALIQCRHVGDVRDNAKASENIAILLSGKGYLQSYDKELLLQLFPVISEEKELMRFYFGKNPYGVKGSIFESMYFEIDYDEFRSLFEIK